MASFPSCEIFPNASCYNIPLLTKNGGNARPFQYDIIRNIFRYECFNGNGANYRGDETLSKSGMACERWDLDTHRGLRETYAWANLESSFCRNPDGRQRPWCYVEGGFEDCDIVPCDGVGCRDPGKPSFGQRSPLLKFFKDGDWITFTCDRGYKFREDSPPNRAQCIVTQTQNQTTARWSSRLPHCEVDHKLTLTRDIFSAEVYNKAFAPSKGGTVYVHAYIENVISLDEKNEQIVTAVKIALEWEDERLEWRRNEYGGLEVIYAGDDTVWKPGLTLKRNFNTEYKGGFPSTDVRVSNTGKVQRTLEFLASTTCTLDPFLFPLDNMTCPVCLKGGPDTIIACAKNITGTAPDDGDFLTCSKTSAPIVTGEWSGRVTLSAANNTACLTITIQRDPGYHYATTISPCIILVVLMIITFIMPIDKGDRIGFGITVLLSMVVSLVVVTGFLPVKGTLPFIAKLIIVAMGMMGGFMLVTLCIIIIHDRKGALPPWARRVFLQYLARMLFMGDLTRKLRGSDEHGGLQSDEVHCNLSVSNKVRPGAANGNDVANGHDVTTHPPTKSQQNEVDSNAPGLQGTLDELKSSVRHLSGSIEALAKANSGDAEVVTEYKLLAYVLDRICLFLYVAGIFVAIPCTLHLGR
ncbi:neuronal acetylcholine receptor subunit beta-3-like [Branchiostoma lanceolatum]|uniref:neuronal acetylcholine receptor subunit beta-3-like n=1 Tax=Branchiostoma lanceolatum TaxID=7740 RepID=UPI0034515CA4